MLRYAVFPVSGLVARVGMTEEGKSCQLSLCGRDGLMGVSMILGGRPLSVLAPVLAHMTAYRLPTAAAQAVWREQAVPMAHAALPARHDRRDDAGRIVQQAPQRRAAIEPMAAARDGSSGAPGYPHHPGDHLAAAG